MTHYRKLQSSGQLTKDACRAILFNSNLTSYKNIATIATENCIPASYIVAKVIKYPNSRDFLKEWICKVPSTKALFEYIHHLDRSRQASSRNLLAEEDFKEALRQCQMDLTAHLSFILSAEGTSNAFTTWKKWVDHATIGLTPGTKALVLQLPTLQLLKRASVTPIEFSVLRFVLRHDDFKLPLQDNFRRHLVNVLMSNSSLICNLETAMMLMDSARNSFELSDIAKYTVQMIHKWMPVSLEQIDTLDKKWVAAFLEKSIENCQDADFDTRATLARIKAELEACKLKRGVPTESELVGE